MKEYNIYIDESCHLENDGIPIMCLGFTKIERKDYERHKLAIHGLKLKHKSPTEIKWNKLSLSRLELYKDIIDYFFLNDISFRCVLIKNKEALNHQYYNDGDHDKFYYKTIYLLLNNHFINEDNYQYRVYLDIKDTRSKQKLIDLEEYLNRNQSNLPKFSHFQHIRSHENHLLQLTDLLIGAVSYKSRQEHLKPGSSEVKKEVINYLEKKTGYVLDDGTTPWEKKFNIFDFQLRSDK